RGVVRALSDRVGVEPAAQNVVGELLVVAADAGMQSVVLLDHGSLDLVEAVRAVALADDGEHALAAGLVSGEEVAHSARRVHGCHSSIFPGPERPADGILDRRAPEGAGCRFPAPRTDIR